MAVDPSSKGKTHMTHQRLRLLLLFFKKNYWAFPRQNQKGDLLGGKCILLFNFMKSRNEGLER